MKTPTSVPSLVLLTFGTETSPKAVAGACKEGFWSSEVRGVQSQGVMAVVKHFAMNEQELLVSISFRSVLHSRWSEETNRNTESPASLLKVTILTKPCFTW